MSLLDEIDAFLRVAGLKESTFGMYAVRDGRFVSRLRAGSRCWPETEQKVRDFIAARTPPAVPIERATGGAVTRHELRPDIYPREDRIHAAAADEGEGE